MRRYFVTGGTGVVGSALVPVLLEDPADEVVLLVRAPDEPTLSARVDELFRFWQFGDREPEMRSRVRAVRGDATEPELGLAPGDRDQLVASVTHIVHAAGAVRMNLPLEEARRSAVGSARQIVALAWALEKAGRLRKVEFVSTVGVGGRMRVVPETWIDTPREFHNTYEQSKAEAEDLVRREIERGLPITVHRPSMVIGDSRTGRIIHFQVFYHLCEFLSGRRTFGIFPPIGSASLDIVPSDVVARAIGCSSKTELTAGVLLHCASGHERSVPLTMLRDLVRERWHTRRHRVPRMLTLPGWLFTLAVRGVGITLPARQRYRLRGLPILLEYLATEQTFENVRSETIFSGMGIGERDWRWQTVVQRALDYYLDLR